VGKFIHWFKRGEGRKNVILLRGKGGRGGVLARRKKGKGAAEREAVDKGILCMLLGGGGETHPSHEK